MGAGSESAFWLAVAWMAIIASALVATQWKPRHTHPGPARCQCMECVMRRVRR